MIFQIVEESLFYHENNQTSSNSYQYAYLEKILFISIP